MLINYTAIRKLKKVMNNKLNKRAHGNVINEIREQINKSPKVAYDVGGDMRIVDATEDMIREGKELPNMENAKYELKKYKARSDKLNEMNELRDRYDSGEYRLFNNEDDYLDNHAQSVNLGKDMMKDMSKVNKADEKFTLFHVLKTGDMNVLDKYAEMFDGDKEKALMAMIKENIPSSQRDVVLDYVANNDKLSNGFKARLYRMWNEDLDPNFNGRTQGFVREGEVTNEDIRNATNQLNDMGGNPMEMSLVDAGDDPSKLKLQRNYREQEGMVDLYDIDNRKGLDSQTSNAADRILDIKHNKMVRGLGNEEQRMLEDLAKKSSNKQGDMLSPKQTANVKLMMEDMLTGKNGRGSYVWNKNRKKPVLLDKGMKYEDIPDYVMRENEELNDIAKRVGYPSFGKLMADTRGRSTDLVAKGITREDFNRAKQIKTNQLNRQKRRGISDPNDYVDTKHIDIAEAKRDAAEAFADEVKEELGFDVREPFEEQKVNPNLERSYNRFKDKYDDMMEEVYQLDNTPDRFDNPGEGFSNAKYEGMSDTVHGKVIGESGKYHKPDKARRKKAIAEEYKRRANNLKKEKIDWLEEVKNTPMEELTKPKKKKFVTIRHGKVVDERITD